MRNMTRISIFEPHKLKGELKELRVAQYDMANCIQIDQSTLSKYLNGINPMPENVEQKITGILDRLKSKKAK